MPVVIPDLRSSIDVEVPAGESTRVGSIRLTPGKPTRVSARELALLGRIGVRVRVLPDPIPRPAVGATVPEPGEASEDPGPAVEEPEPKKARRRKRDRA